MDTVWSKDVNIGRYTYLVGKYRKCKNKSKLRSTVKNMRTHYTSLQSAWQHTNMHWSQFHSYTKLRPKTNPQCNLKFKHKLCAHDIESIGQFYQSDVSSFPLPNKKFAGKRFMRRSLAKSCKMYNLLPSTTRKICHSTFCKYKPKYVKLQGKIPLQQSCCEVCQNFEYVVGQASRYLDGVPTTIDSCIDSSMCAYTTYFPKIDCALCNCEECTLDNLKSRLETMNVEKLQDTRECFLIKK